MGRCPLRVWFLETPQLSGHLTVQALESWCFKPWWLTQRLKSCAVPCPGRTWPCVACHVVSVAPPRKPGCRESPPGIPARSRALSMKPLLTNFRVALKSRRRSKWVAPPHCEQLPQDVYGCDRDFLSGENGANGMPWW